MLSKAASGPVRLHVTALFGAAASGSSATAVYTTVFTAAFSAMVAAAPDVTRGASFRSVTASWKLVETAVVLSAVLSDTETVTSKLGFASKSEDAPTK